MTEKEERLKPQESFFRIVDYLIEEAHFQVKKTEGGIISYSLEIEPSFDDIQREGKCLVRVVTLYGFAKGEQEGRMVHDISVKIEQSLKQFLSQKTRYPARRHTLYESHERIDHKVARA